jgi:hypothetical protein
VIEAWTVALLASTAVHAGFQLTVTFVVYPGLADVQPGPVAGRARPPFATRERPLLCWH